MVVKVGLRAFIESAILKCLLGGGGWFGRGSGSDACCGGRVLVVMVA